MKSRTTATWTVIAAATLLVAGGWVAPAEAQSRNNNSRDDRSHQVQNRGRDDHRRDDRGRDNHRHVTPPPPVQRDSRVSFSFSFGNILPPPPPRVVHVPVTTVCSPGYYQTQWVPPVYQTGHDHWGRPVSVLVRPGYHQQVWVPGQCTTGPCVSCTAPVYGHRPY